MLNSIRNRLLIGQLLLLTSVVCGFGATVFFQWRARLFANLDAELLSSATVLEGTLRGAFPVDNPDQPSSREGRVILAGDIAADLLALPHNLILNSDARTSTYFVIYDMHDQVIAASGDRDFRIPAIPLAQQEFHFEGAHRELVLVGPGITRILVGRDTSALHNQSSSFLLMLTSVGIGILTVACAAGYWLTGRAIIPIRRMSETVRSISGRNLAKRIDTASMDSEFVSLADLLNKMLDRLTGAIELQRQFVADASHELRTPLSVIGMHSELALVRDRTPEEYRATLAICLRASNRLRALTDDLLVLAKSDSGQLARADEDVELKRLVDESIEFLRPLADQNNVSLVNESTSSVCTHGDRRLLRQLIDNLLTNAIVHNRQGGQARVSVEKTEDKVVLIVSDNGPGIPEEEIPRLFDRFSKVGEARSRSHGGSGLGLSICQSIARIHGGIVSAKSELGNGTVLEFCMPNVRPVQPARTDE